MTRETKIGLLVGLAFIIVIGILLSDHLTSSTEPPQAALANAGNNVRQAVANPGQAAPQLPAVQPSNSAPTAQVPTRDELTPGPNPMTIVKVGPANTPANTPTNSPADNSQTSRIVKNPAQVASNDNGQASSSDATDPPKISRVPSGATSMNDVAKQHGEELVLVDGNGRAIRGTLSQRTNGAEYKAQAGDSLSKMAQKLMGANTKANRDAIVAANASLKSDPNKVIVGRTYVIPAVSAPPTDSPAAPTSTTESQPAPANSDPAEKSAENWYTVKAGDSLWKIATEQCGRAGAMAAIKELNKDLLVGDSHDQVVAGMKLRLPSKPAAQSNS